MQQRMRNTKYQFYNICVEAPVFITLVKNCLLLQQKDNPESPELTFVPVVKLAPFEENEDEGE